MSTPKGYWYISTPEKKLRLISERVLHSWSPPRVVVSSDAALAKYRYAANLKFRNGSLIWNLADGKVYLIESGKRRHVVSPDAFTRIGAVYDDAIAVSIDEINLHPLGEELT